MPRPFKTIVGQTFGHLTAVESLGKNIGFGYRTRGERVRASCSCGGEWIGTADALKSGNTQSCGCLAPGSKPVRDRTLPALRRLLRNYRRHALRRGHEWAISEDRFRELVAKNCHYCGDPPRRVATANRSTIKKPRRCMSEVVYNGIDRKDNSLGYTEGNIVPACSICNYSKRDLSAEEFLSHMRKICRQHAGKA